MPDAFVHEFVGNQVIVEIVGQHDLLRAELLAVGEQWLKLLIGTTVTLVPISSVKSLRVDETDY
jgi:hypothetical protein